MKLNTIDAFWWQFVAESVQPLYDKFSLFSIIIKKRFVVLSIFKAVSFIFIFVISCTSVFADWGCANWQDAIQAFSENGKDTEIASIIGGGKKYGIHKRTANADETEFLAKRVIEIAHKRPDNPFHDRTDTHLAKFIEPFKAIDLTALEADDAKGLREHLGCVAGIYHITVAADQVVDEVYQHLTFGVHDNFGDLSREGFIRRVKNKLLFLKIKWLRDPFVQSSLAKGISLCDSYYSVTSLALERILFWYEQVLQNTGKGWREETESLLADGIINQGKILGFQFVRNKHKEVIAVIKPVSTGRRPHDINREALNFELSQYIDSLNGTIAENFIANPIPSLDIATKYKKVDVAGPGSVLVERFYPYADKAVLRNMLVAGGYEKVRQLLQKGTIEKFKELSATSPLLANSLSYLHLRMIEVDDDLSSAKKKELTSLVYPPRDDKLFKMLIAAYLFGCAEAGDENIVTSLGGFHMTDVCWTNTQYSHGAKLCNGTDGSMLPEVMRFLKDGRMTTSQWPILDSIGQLEDMESLKGLKSLFTKYCVDSAAFQKRCKRLSYISGARFMLDEPTDTDEETENFIREVYKVVRGHPTTTIIKVMRLLYFVNNKFEEFNRSPYLWALLKKAG